jgi:hypothetical protein
MEKNKNKGKAEKTGSEAHYKPFGLHFLRQPLGYTENIRPEKITLSFTNTFNQTYRVCQGFRFDGVYKRVGNNIKLSSNLILKIQERKQVIGRKPIEYLSLYTIRQGKQKYLCYISSLFKIEGKENTYWFDYWFEGKKVYYIMELTDTTAKIKGSLFTSIY